LLDPEEEKPCLSKYWITLIRHQFPYSGISLALSYSTPISRGPHPRPSPALFSQAFPVSFQKDKVDENKTKQNKKPDKLASPLASMLRSAKW